MRGSAQLPASYFVCYLVQCLKLNNSLQSFFSNDFSEGRMTKQLAFKEWKKRSWLFLSEISFQRPDWVILIIDQESQESPQLTSQKLLEVKALSCCHQNADPQLYSKALHTVLSGNQTLLGYFFSPSGNNCKAAAVQINFFEI